MNVKASRRLKVLRTLVVLFLLPVALFGLTSVYAIITDSEGRHYERMKQSCQEGIWAVVYDSPWYHVQEIEKPYPAQRGDVVGNGMLVALACTEEEASEQRSSLRRSGDVAYFLGMGALLVVPVVAMIALWWFIEELRHWRSRGSL